MSSSERESELAAENARLKRQLAEQAEELVTNGAIVIHTQRLKSDPGGNLLS
ncbi:lacI-family transcriptional regulator domain protein [Escherichia coli DEC2D]|uniref:LacI-family transcriptional regulator domain protein n=1 Tax=Escherichia coli DEC2D TaxID=868141 RepID=A0A828U0L8_ECOLX|nr:lacI-family transcriptional regulator domain protein [Escherichia coli DEC2D]